MYDSVYDELLIAVIARKAAIRASRDRRPSPTSLSCRNNQTCKSAALKSSPLLTWPNHSTDDWALTRSRNCITASAVYWYFHGDVERWCYSAHDELINSAGGASEQRYARCATRGDTFVSLLWLRAGQVPGRARCRAHPVRLNTQVPGWYQAGNRPASLHWLSVHCSVPGTNSRHVGRRTRRLRPGGCRGHWG
jgi:hypothetical protein